ESVYSPGIGSPTIYALPETWDALHQHLFNDVLYPDFIRISAQGHPILEWQALVANKPVLAAGLRLTPIPVHHTVPTVAYTIEDHQTALAFVTDTGPSDDIWRACAKLKNLRAVFLECAFPTSLHELANRAGHLCTDLIPAELAKLACNTPVY